MTSMLNRISAPLLIGSIINLGTAALPGTASAQEGGRFVFRHKPIPIALSVGDGGSGQPSPETSTPPPYEPAEGLRFVPEFEAPALLAFGRSGQFQLAVVIENDGEATVRDLTMSVTFGPWGSVEAQCFTPEGNTISPGGYGVCVGQLAVDSNSQIRALGRDPGDLASVVATAHLTSLDGVSLAAGQYQVPGQTATVAIGSHFLPRYTASAIRPDMSVAVISEAFPMLVPSDADELVLPDEDPISDDLLPSRNVAGAAYHARRQVSTMSAADELGELDMYITRKLSGGYELAFFAPNGNAGFPYASGPVAVIDVP